MNRFNFLELSIADLRMTIHPTEKLQREVWDCCWSWIRQPVRDNEPSKGCISHFYAYLPALIIPTHVLHGASASWICNSSPALQPQYKGCRILIPIFQSRELWLMTARKFCWLLRCYWTQISFIAIILPACPSVRLPIYHLSRLLFHPSHMWAQGSLLHSCQPGISCLMRSFGICGSPHS